MTSGIVTVLKNSYYTLRLSPARLALVAMPGRDQRQRNRAKPDSIDRVNSFTIAGPISAPPFKPRPHLHVLAASGLVDREGRFHVLPWPKFLIQLVHSP